MPPKEDPYATSSARAADLLLILITIIAILFAIWTAPPSRARAGEAGTQSPSSLGKVQR